MCGIAGYFGIRPPGQTQTGACLSAMRRRGPDHAGMYRETLADGTQVVLLHSRLQIIDLDPRSNQPLRYARKVLSYNGELYNYVELREALIQEGVIFETRSDTEVLIAALSQWGLDALDRFEGMWAFALFDEQTKGLTLCRDRFGEKPLYVYEDADGVYFASETRFLAELRGAPLDVDEDQLQRYMVNGYKALHKRDRTFYRGVRQLPAGSWLQIRAGRAGQPRQYWEPRYNPDQSMSYDDAVAAVRSELRESVRLRMRADVPVAFLLSGGVDSSGLVGMAKRALGAEVHAFTLVHDDERYDEREAVQHTVADLGIEHTAVPIARDGFRDRLGELIRYHDAPLFTTTSYVQWLLMEQIAARGYRVVVTGVGADELFSGYYDHHNLFLGEMYGTDAYDAARAAWDRHIAPVVRNPHLKDPDLYVRTPEFRGHVYLNNEWFGSCTRRGWQEAFEERAYASSLMRSRMLNELRHESVPVILHEDDLNAMFFSLENRAPYLSRRLCELSYRIPTRHLIRDGRTKSPLRDALRGVVPNRILDNRTKVGFNAPIGSMLQLDDPETRAWLLDKGPVFDLVRRDKLESMLSLSQVPNSVSKFLFSFVCAKTFLEQRTVTTESESWQVPVQARANTTSCWTSSSPSVAPV